EFPDHQEIDRPHAAPRGNPRRSDHRGNVQEERAPADAARAREAQHQPGRHPRDEASAGRAVRHRSGPRADRGGRGQPPEDPRRRGRRQQLRSGPDRLLRTGKRRRDPRDPSVLRRDRRFGSRRTRGKRSARLDRRERRRLGSVRLAWHARRRGRRCRRADLQRADVRRELLCTNRLRDESDRMNIDAKLVKDLRERTGAGMMDCKKALAETEGDMERAIAVLREKGLAGASKKAGRVAADGLVGVFASPDSKTAVLVELNCETDFVAKTDAFRSLFESLGNALLAADVTEGNADTVAGLVMPDGKTVSALLTESIAQIGENLGLRRFSRFASANGVVGCYVHAGGNIGVIVELAGGDSRHVELAKSLAMQVAAAFPRVISRDQVSQG